MKNKIKFFSKQKKFWGAKKVVSRKCLKCQCWDEFNGCPYEDCPYTKSLNNSDVY